MTPAVLCRGTVPVQAVGEVLGPLEPQVLVDLDLALRGWLLPMHRRRRAEGDRTPVALIWCSLVWLSGVQPWCPAPVLFPVGGWRGDPAGWASPVGSSWSPSPSIAPIP